MKIFYVNTIDTVEAQSNNQPMHDALAEHGSVWFFDYRKKDESTQAMNKRLVAEAVNFKPDLIYMGKCERVSAAAIHEIKKEVHCFVIHYYGDYRPDPEPFVVELGKRVNLTLFCNKNQKLINLYKLKGVREIDYFRAGVDPKVYKPYEEEKEYDFVFFGNNNPDFLPGYSFRREVLEYLANMKQRVLIHGVGWNHLAKYSNVTLGSFVIDEKFARACSRAHFSIGINAVSDVPAYTSWPRTLRCMAVGVPHLCQNVPGIQNILPGRSVIYFRKMKDIKGFVEAYNKNPYLGKYDDIGENGRRHVAENETWDNRAAKIIDFYQKLWIGQ